MQWISRLAELIEDWNYLIQGNGRRSDLYEIAQEIMTLPYQRLQFSVLACSLLELLPDLQPKIALEIREFEPNDLALVRQIHRPSEARSCARRLARGHIGLIVFHKGEPAGYAWGCPEVEPTLERVYLKLDPGDMLCIDAYTAPAFRGQGVQTALTLARCKLFRELGYRRAISFIGIHNYPSLAVWRKFGSQVVGTIDFIRVGPWRWTRYSRGDSAGDVTVSAD